MNTRKSIFIFMAWAGSLLWTFSHAQTPIEQDFSFEEKQDARYTFELGMTIQQVRSQTPGSFRPSFAKRIDGVLVQVYQVVQTYGRKLGPLAPPSWTQKKNDLYLYFIDGKLRFYAPPGDWESVAENLVRTPVDVVDPGKVSPIQP